MTKTATHADNVSTRRWMQVSAWGAMACVLQSCATAEATTPVVENCGVYGTATLVKFEVLDSNGHVARTLPSTTPIGGVVWEQEVPFIGGWNGAFLSLAPEPEREDITYQAHTCLYVDN